jgi:hypothetical protein
MLGIEPEGQDELADPARRRPQKVSCDEDRKWQLEAIRANIEKANTGETVPLPRDQLMDLRVERREKELLLKQASFEARKAERQAAAQLRADAQATDNTVTRPGAERRRNKNKKPRTN